MEATGAIEQGMGTVDEEERRRVRQEIEQVKGKIEEVENEIKMAKAKGDKEEVKQLRDELKQLRDELKQLRDKELKLMDKELKLMDRQSLLAEGLKRNRDEEPGDESSRSPRGLKPAPQALADFWRELRNAKLMEGEKFLQLVDATSFLGDSGLGNKLMLRECYRTLEEKLEGDFREGAHGRVIVGTPGIGKSMFGFWLLYRWARRDERVVLVKDNFFGDAAILLCPDGAFMLDNRQLLVEVANPQTKFLLDAITIRKTGYPSGQLVMLTSSERDRYKACKRNGYWAYYMNVWTLEELEECRSLMYPHLEVRGVKDRWDKWGGVPRYVLEKIKDVDQLEICKAIECSSIDIVNQARTFRAADHLFHVKVEADFINARMDWASLWVAERVAHKAWQNEKEKLIQLIRVSTELPAFGTLQGKLWEGLCHDRLAEGGLFKIRDLVGEEVQQLHLPSCGSPHIFDSLDEVRGMNGNVYCRPRATNLAAIESLRQPGALYQITFAERHGIDCAGLENALTVMQSDRLEVRFYFVVPQHLFMSFQKQPMVARGGVDTAELANVKQYALEIRYDDLRDR